MLDLDTLQKFAEERRSIYALGKHLSVSNEAVIKLVEHAILHTPSSFNSQSTRIIVLFGDEHQKLWQITEDTLRNIVGDNEAFVATKQKIDSFKAGTGTVLFYEDHKVIKALQEFAPLYADKFPVWAQHTNAMHQYVIWTEMASLNIGANLQHYNPIIDEQVARTWNVDADWELAAQLVFGSIEQTAGEKAFEPVEKRLQVFGA